MRILYIADSTSIHTKRWVKYFLEAGNEISLITIGKKTETIPGVRHLANFESFYYKNPSFVSVFMKARRLIRAERPDFLHAHFVHQYGWLGALSGFHPFVLTAWGTDILSLPYESRSGIGKLLTRYSLKKADLLTGTSEYLKKEMMRLGAREDKVHVIHWGVDPGLFRPDIDYAKLKKVLQIGARLVVLSNRNQIALYNNDIVIEAMSIVKQKFGDVVLILQNAGGPLERDLRRLAREKGIGDSTIFLPQFEYDQMPALYAMADVYVSVPSWDGGPVSLVEAMAAGCAPIISAVPGPMEWVKDEVNGKVVPVRDIDCLAEAVCELLSNEGKREKFKEMSRRLIEEKADHRVLMKRAEALYVSLGGQAA
jgi:glycosyltransferase involved in cell wall biosynthesis